MQRQYIRKYPKCLHQKNFHLGFKTWVEENSLFLTEGDWEEIMTEDAAHNYDTHPLSYPPVLDDDLELGDEDAEPQGVVQEPQYVDPEAENGDSGPVSLGPINPQTYEF